MDKVKLLDYLDTRRGANAREAKAAVEKLFDDLETMTARKVQIERHRQHDVDVLKRQIAELSEAGSLDAMRLQVDQLKDLVARYAEAAEQQKAEAVRELTAHGYYRDQLAQAHTLIGRIVHQFAQTGWDAVRLSDFFPTDNPGGVRGPLNPGGDNE